jgi:hypothetical protein
MFVALQYPTVRADFLSQSKSGRTSAPRVPHAVQIKRGSRSDSRTSSAQASPLISIEWRDQSILQRFHNPVQPCVYGRDLTFQAVDLSARCRIQDTDRRATA